MFLNSSRDPLNQYKTFPICILTNFTKYIFIITAYSNFLFCFQLKVWDNSELDLYYTNKILSLKIELTNKQVEVIKYEIPHDIYLGSIVTSNG